MLCPRSSIEVRNLLLHGPGEFRYEKQYETWVFEKHAKCFENWDHYENVKAFHRWAEGLGFLADFLIYLETNIDFLNKAFNNKVFGFVCNQIHIVLETSFNDTIDDEFLKLIALELLKTCGPRMVKSGQCLEAELPWLLKSWGDSKQIHWLAAPMGGSVVYTPRAKQQPKKKATPKKSPKKPAAKSSPKAPGVPAEELTKVAGGETGREKFWLDDLVLLCLIDWAEAAAAAIIFLVACFPTSAYLTSPPPGYLRVCILGGFPCLPLSSVVFVFAELTVSACLCLALVVLSASVCVCLIQPALSVPCPSVCPCLSQSASVCVFDPLCF